MNKRNKLFGISILISIILILIILFRCIVENGDKPLLDEHTKILNNWTYYTSENSKVMDIKLPWKPDYKKNGVVITMSTKLPNESVQDPCIMIKTYMKSIWVYVDNKEVFKRNFNEKSNKILFNGINWSMMDLPQNSNGKIITIKIESIYPQKEGKIEEVLWGDKGFVKTDMLKGEKIDNILAIAMLFIGSCSIILFILAILIKKIYGNLFYIGLFSLLCGAWIFSKGNLLLLMQNNNELCYMIEFITFYSIPIPLLLFIKYTYKIDKIKLLNNLVSTFAIFLLIALLMQSFNIIALHKLLKLYHLLLVINSIIYIYILIIEILNKNKEFTIFFVGCTIMLVLNLINLIIFYTIDSYRINYYVNLSMLIFIITLIVSLGRYIINLSNSHIREEVMRRLAYIDISTGLKNRLSFENVMEELSKSLCNNSEFCILVFDLDNLKLVNDSLGHSAGDIFIKTSAEILKKAYSNIGEVYRIGGDEFVCIVKDKGKKDIKKAEKKQIKYMKNNNEFSEMKVRISFGKAYFKYGKDEDLYSVFRRADEEMYRYKKFHKARKCHKVIKRWIRSR